MTRFAMGSAMGFMLGAGLMMMPAGRAIRRDAKHAVCKMRRWLRSM
ncbi:MAG: hypothetical protein ACI4MJ_03935 [Aristaeellaceae bacterium]